jgi:hypothetical protein
MKGGIFGEPIILGRAKAHQNDYLEGGTASDTVNTEVHANFDCSFPLTTAG